MCSCARYRVYTGANIANKVLYNTRVHRLLLLTLSRLVLRMVICVLSKTKSNRV